MNFSQKIIYIQESLKQNDKEFASKYKIKLATLRNWKSGKVVPTENEIKLICKDYNLDVNDFLNDKSTLNDPKKGEHLCATVVRADSSNVIYEDFAREDNSRYEEKD